MKYYSRGQTLLEFVIAMPIALLALFGIVYMSHYAVLSERAELALRYGGIAAFTTQSNSYSAGNIYQNLYGLQPNCPKPDLGILSGGGPMPGPTSAPFWQPDTDVLPETSSCTASASGFGGSQFIASHFWAITTVNVNASVDVPSYVQTALGSNTASANTTATFIHAAYPGVILWCSVEVRRRVDGAVTAQDSSPLPTPIPDGAPMPTPPPNNNGHCD